MSICPKNALCGSATLNKLEERFVSSKVHREIISRPDLLSGSVFYSIHPDPLRSAPDPSPSAPTGTTFDQI